VALIVSQPFDLIDAAHASASDDSIIAIASVQAVDLLVGSLSAANHVTGPQTISDRLPSAMLYRAATTEYDLRPLSDDLPTDGDTGDLLADILAESALALPL